MTGSMMVGDPDRYEFVAGQDMPAGSVVVAGELIGITIRHTPLGRRGAALLEGQFLVTAASGEEWTIGQPLYYDAVAQEFTTSSGGSAKFAGFSISNKGIGSSAGGIQLASQSSASTPAMNEGTYWANLDTVAERITEGTCRLCIVGDSISQVTGTNGTAGTRFSHGLLRKWKPEHWIGADAAPNSFDLGGTWFAQRQAVTGITHYLSTGQPNLPGQNNSIADFNAATPVGFHPNWLFMSDVADSTGAGSAYRLFVAPGGTFFDESWRDPEGNHKLIAQGAEFRFTPYWYVLGDETTDSRNSIAEVGGTLTQGNGAFGWTGIGWTATVPNPGSGEWGLAYGYATGTLSTAPADPDSSGLTAGFQGFGINVTAPGGGNWSDEVTGASGGRWFFGGCAVERTDTPDGKGLFVGHIANGGWRATNHRYEPADEYAPDLDSGFYPSYRDDALAAHIELLRYDTFLIYLGVNDSGMTSGDEDAEAFAANVLEVIGRYRTAHATAQANDPTIQDAKFIVVAPVASVNDAGRRAEMANYPEALKALAGGDVSFIDLYQLWVDEFGAYSSWQATYLEDGIHPNVAGQDAWASRLWDQVLNANGAAKGVSAVAYAGAGFGGATTAPAQQGDSDSPAYDETPIAWWTVAQKDLTRGTKDPTFKAAVAAYHYEGIEKVTFQVEGGVPVDVTTPTRAADGVLEYSVEVKGEFPGNEVEVRATVVPNSGVPIVLQDTDESDFNAPSLWHYVDPQGLLTTEVHIATTGDDATGDGTLGNPFATFTGAKQYLSDELGTPGDNDIFGVRFRFAAGTYDWDPVGDSFPYTDDTIGVTVPCEVMPEDGLSLGDVVIARHTTGSLLNASGLIFRDIEFAHDESNARSTVDITIGTPTAATRNAIVFHGCRFTQSVGFDWATAGMNFWPSNSSGNPMSSSFVDCEFEKTYNASVLGFLIRNCTMRGTCSDRGLIAKATVGNTIRHHGVSTPYGAWTEQVALGGGAVHPNFCQLTTANGGGLVIADNDFGDSTSTTEGFMARDAHASGVFRNIALVNNIMDTGESPAKWCILWAENDPQGVTGEPDARHVLIIDNTVRGDLWTDTIYDPSPVADLTYTAVKWVNNRDLVDDSVRLPVPEADAGGGSFSGGRPDPLYFPFFSTRSNIYFDAEGDYTVPASITATATISGSTTIGSELTCSVLATDGALDNIGRIASQLTTTYQWQRDGVDIAGATSSTYTLVEADADADITCDTSSTDYAGRSDTATSNTITAGPSVGGDGSSGGGTLYTTDGSVTLSASHDAAALFNNSNPPTDGATTPDIPSGNFWCHSVMTASSITNATPDDVTVVYYDGTARGHYENDVPYLRIRRTSDDAILAWGAAVSSFGAYLHYQMQSTTQVDDLRGETVYLEFGTAAFS